MEEKHDRKAWCDAESSGLSEVSLRRSGEAEI